MESIVEINKSSHQQKPNYGGNQYSRYSKNRGNGQSFKNRNNYGGKKNNSSAPKVQCKFCFRPKGIFKICQLMNANVDIRECYTKAKSAKSTAEFIKNCSGNSTHIDEIELEALAKLMDHPIKCVIEEINMFCLSRSGGEKWVTHVTRWLESMLWSKGVWQKHWHKLVCTQNIHHHHWIWHRNCFPNCCKW